MVSLLEKKEISNFGFASMNFQQEKFNADLIKAKDAKSSLCSLNPCLMILSICSGVSMSIVINPCFKVQSNDTVNDVHKGEDQTTFFFMFSIFLRTVCYLKHHHVHVCNMNMQYCKNGFFVLQRIGQPWAISSLSVIHLAEIRNFRLGIATTSNKIFFKLELLPRAAAATVATNRTRTRRETFFSDKIGSTKRK